MKLEEMVQELWDREKIKELTRAAAGEPQHAGLLAVDLVDLREHAGGLEVHRLRRMADLAAAGQADHAEAGGATQAVGHEVEVARLEDLQREPPAGEQHRAQREEGECVDPLAAGRCVGTRTRHSRATSSRWRTSVALRSAKRRASASTSHTERCWPPVQPIATVR